VTALKVVVLIAGVAAVLATLGSALRVVVLPRGIPSRLARRVIRGVRIVFNLRLGRKASYERRDAVMALYGPISLVMLLVAWLTLTAAAYVAMFWALGERTLREAFLLSGSSLLTLGFQHPADIPSVVLAFSEAAIGLFLLALLITYLPSLYAAFSRREAMVAMLEVRAGSPPTGVEMIERSQIIEALDLESYWKLWERWFVDIEESHLTFPSLVFFRSPQPERSWITSAGAVLDGAALVASTLDIPRQSEAELCIRAGYLALRQIARFFRIPFNPDPQATDPISITRAEYDAAYDRLALAGTPLKADRDQAWRDFAGWRVNYDTVLIELSKLTVAPYAPWVSDREALSSPAG
jgi:hypothetical protein